MSSLEEFRGELETCFGTSCGFCERGCPVYQSMKVKTLCMKGRNRTMLGLIQGKFEITPAVVQAAFECTLCGNCDRWCSLKNTEHTRAFRGPDACEVHRQQRQTDDEEPHASSPLRPTRPNVTQPSAG